LIGLLLPLSHAAAVDGLLCALKGQAADRCRAHLTLFSILAKLDYWINGWYLYKLFLCKYRNRIIAADKRRREPEKETAAQSFDNIYNNFLAILSILQSAFSHLIVTYKCSIRTSYDKN
jgi:hypothetical protein